MVPYLCFHWFVCYVCICPCRLLSWWFFCLLLQVSPICVVRWMSSSLSAFASSPPRASVSVLLGLGFSTWFCRSMLFSCVSRFVFVLQGPLLIFFVYVIDVEAEDVACLHLFCVPICICLFASVHVDSVSCSMHVPVICCLYHSCFFFPMPSSASIPVCLPLPAIYRLVPVCQVNFCVCVLSVDVISACVLWVFVVFFFLSPAGRCLSACSSEDSPISLISASQAFLRAVYFCIYCSMMVLC